jgi:hypothetical protein
MSPCDSLSRNPPGTVGTPGSAIRSKDTHDHPYFFIDTLHNIHSKDKKLFREDFYSLHI